MDPSAMANAMAMLKDMPPEQLQRMMGSMGNITPEMMQQAQSMASRMGKDDWERARSQMGSMSPDQLQQQASQAQAQFAAQQNYTLTASQHLKNEGNQLHSSGKYAEAIEKYGRAKKNVEAFTSSEAAELRKACTLNMSSCYLNMKEWSLCIAECNDVLAGEPDSLKALYRRGQAYMGIQGWAQAVDDLARAVKLSSSDPAQQKLIKEKLQDAKDQLGIQRASPALQSSQWAPSTSLPSQQHTTAPPTPAPASAITAPSPTRGASASSSAPASTSAPGGLPPNVDPRMLKEVAEMMRSNPDLAKQAAQMYRDMSDDQLRELSRTMGQEITRDSINPNWAENLNPERLEQLAQLQQQMPGVPPGMPPGANLSPEMIKAATEAFKTMKPEELQAMTEMAAKMIPQSAASASLAPSGTSSSSAVAPASQASGSSSNSTVVPSAGMAGPMPAMTPEMAKMAAEMMSGMSAEQLASLTASMGGGAGGGAGGMPALTPEMAKMAAEMMSKMGPEEMQRMSEMMGRGGMPGMPGSPPMMPGMGMAGGMGGARPGVGASADMLAQMDPKMMESAMSMMRTMDPKAMADMLMSSGMVKSQEQAEQMARQMNSMSDSQMKMMMKAANVAQAGAKALKKTKDFVSSRTMLIIGLVILLLAILLRVVWGW